MERLPATYILTNRKNGVLYVGVTNNLVFRVYRHRTTRGSGFTKRYNVTRLVYFERCETMLAAIAREKQLKAGSRKAKIKLIESVNPDWRDLFEDICC